MCCLVNSSKRFQLWDIVQSTLNSLNNFQLNKEHKKKWRSRSEGKFFSCKLSCFFVNWKLFQEFEVCKFRLSTVVVFLINFFWLTLIPLKKFGGRSLVSFHLTSFSHSLLIRKKIFQKKLHATSGKDNCSFKRIKFWERIHAQI